MEITNIQVRYVKGIESLDVKCRLFPNKPNFLVGPNGAGKSSLATAFRSLNKKRLKLVESDFFNGSAHDDAMLSVELDNARTLVADGTRNEIGGELDVFVINSGLYAAQIPKYANGRSVSEARISVPDVELWKRAPQRAAVGYKYTDMQSQYPERVRKCFTNFTEKFKDTDFLNRLIETPGFDGETYGKRYSDAIDGFIAQLESIGGTREQMLGAGLDCTRISAVAPVRAIADWIPSFTRDERETARYLDAIQLKRFCESRRPEIKAAASYLAYKESRARIDGLLDAVNTSGRSVRTQKQGDRVLLRLPRRDEVSNGELDIMQFVASLAKAIGALKRPRAILVIDEVFDYLDDGNLLVAQYYLLKMIEGFKARNGELFPVLLTHLDPRTLESYRFKAKHVAFLGSVEEGRIGSYMRDILVDRGNCQRGNAGVYDSVSANYLHYAPSAAVGEETRDYLERKGVPPEAVDPAGFAAEMEAGLQAYLEGESFDAAKVCCALRVMVERHAYESLTDEADKEAFLAIDKGTLPRLYLACEHGADFPEIMFLLSSVYNECMHLDAAASKEPLIVRKLNNGYIKSMIKELVETVRGQDCS